MKQLKRKGLYLPAVAVVTVVVALVVLHAISTFRTLDRDRRFSEDVLQRSAGDFIFMLKLELDLAKADRSELKEFLGKLTDNKDIAYIILIDHNGHRYSASRLPRLPESSLENYRSSGNQETGHRRLIRLSDGRPVFEFTDYLNSSEFGAVVIGLWMTAFEDARKQDEHHALLMVGILVLLAGAAIYFMFVVQHYYVVGRTLDEMRRKLDRSERLASLGTLASGVAHEVRNPLSAVKGFAQYFRDRFETGSEDRSYADIMLQEVERLNRVIDELLDFARPRDLDMRVHSVSEILAHPLQLIRNDLDNKGIKLTTSISDHRVRADADQMTQALLNIFLNAIDAMEKGGELHLATTPLSEEGKVELSIIDTGKGISQENLPRIFEPFYSTKKKGTGLGLAITAKIIEAHRGEILVESKKGEGTTFRIRLPLAIDG